MTKYDLLVIGGGPGGYVAAIKAAQLGLNVALIEKDHLGGTCLNRGCIPTKSLLHAASLYNEVWSWPQLGLACERPSYDYAVMHQRKEAVINQLRDGVAALLKANKVEVIAGEAKMTGLHTVTVGDIDYDADYIIIATGGRPYLPSLPGIDLPGVVTSDDVLGSAIFFQRLAIIGAGVVGLEFASLYRDLGCDVTVLASYDRILPKSDREISQNLSMLMKKRGINIYTSAQLSEIEQGADGLICHFDAKGKEEHICVDGVLVSAGRRCYPEEFLNGVVSLETTERGQIVVDEHFCTSIPHLYAIGDIALGCERLAHAASAAGINAVCHIANHPPEMDMHVVPNCIYTKPEIATVGLSVDEAKSQGIAVKTGKYLMGGNGKSLIELADRGFIKLVCEQDSGRLLGAQLMCCRATDMINELSLAISKGLTAQDIASVIHPHPTFGEGIMEAAEDVAGASIHTMPRRR